MEEAAERTRRAIELEEEQTNDEPVAEELRPGENAPASAEDDSNIVPEQVNVETFNNVVSRLETDGQGTVDDVEEDDALVEARIDEEQKETWKLTSKTTKNFASDSCGARIEKSAPDVTVSSCCRSWPWQCVRGRSPLPEAALARERGDQKSPAPNGASIFPQDPRTSSQIYSTIIWSRSCNYFECRINISIIIIIYP